jgi:hypothetical protein
VAIKVQHYTRERNATEVRCIVGSFGARARAARSRQCGNTPWAKAKWDLRADPKCADRHQFDADVAALVTMALDVAALIYQLYSAVPYYI